MVAFATLSKYVSIVETGFSGDKRMTFSNYGCNPYPWANPMTSSPNTMNSVGFGGRGFVRCNQDAQVPESHGFMKQGAMGCNELRVPCQNQVPMGMEDACYGFGSGDENVFRCMDGTLIDMKSRKVIYDAQKRNNGQLRMIDNPFETKVEDWNQISPQKEIRDMEYQRISNEKSREMLDNMSDTQKKLMKMVDDGMFCSLSRLKEEY